VLSMDNNSVFGNCVSWLLQNVSDSTGKSASTFEYFSDDTIMEEVRTLGHDPQFMLLAMMVRDDLSRVVAMAMTRRALMLALVVAMVIHGKCTLARVTNELRESYPKLAAPFSSLCDLARSAMESDH